MTSKKKQEAIKRLASCCNQFGQEYRELTTILYHKRVQMLEFADAIEALGGEHEAESLRRDAPRAQDAVKKLLSWSPMMKPNELRTNRLEGVEPSDKHAPFFSEAFLYPLLGKDDARTLKMLLTKALKACDLKLEGVLW